MMTTLPLCAKLGNFMFPKADCESLLDVKVTPERNIGNEDKNLQKDDNCFNNPTPLIKLNEEKIKKTDFPEIFSFYSLVNKWFNKLCSILLKRRKSISFSNFVTSSIRNSTIAERQIKMAEETIKNYKIKNHFLLGWLPGTRVWENSSNNSFRICFA